MAKKRQFAEKLPAKPVTGELMDASVLADRSQQLNLAPF